MPLKTRCRKSLQAADRLHPFAFRRPRFLLIALGHKWKFYHSPAFHILITRLLLFSPRYWQGMYLHIETLKVQLFSSVVFGESRTFWAPCTRGKGKKLACCNRKSMPSIFIFILRHILHPTEQVPSKKMYRSKVRGVCFIWDFYIHERISLYCQDGTILKLINNK